MTSAQKHGALSTTAARCPCRLPLIDSAELSAILGEPYATVHRHLTGLLAEGIVGRVSHGTAHLPYGDPTSRGGMRDTRSKVLKSIGKLRRWQYAVLGLTVGALFLTVVEINRELHT